MTLIIHTNDPNTFNSRNLPSIEKRKNSTLQKISKH
jgi:hypothetical protein